MSPNDYDASALAVPYTDDSSDPAGRRSTSPLWTRRSGDSGRARSSASDRPTDLRTRVLRSYDRLNRRALRTYNGLTPLQRVGVLLLGIATLVTGILFLIYHEQILHWLKPIAQKWRDMRGGWAILWAATFIVSFPPLIGYSTCVTLAGLVYGFPNGWFVVASATVVGSTCSFIVSRSLLRNWVERLVKTDARFASLALTLKHDGLKLLIMIRLCPLPYSFSNGAISLIPTVQPLQFAFATAVVSPKLMLHVFVGSQLARLAEDEKMDAKTKAISYVSIVIGIAAGALTGWFIYRQTKRRAAQLEAQERAGVRSETADELRREYADDPAALEAAETLREDEDDISLRTAADYEDDDLGSGYRDFVDDDAQEVDDVFAEGDGGDEDVLPPAGGKG